MSFHKGQEGLIPADQYQKLENTFWYGQLKASLAFKPVPKPSKEVFGTGKIFPICS